MYIAFTVYCFAYVACLLHTVAPPFHNSTPLPFLPTHSVPDTLFPEMNAACSRHLACSCFEDGRQQGIMGLQQEGHEGPEESAAGGHEHQKEEVAKPEGGGNGNKRGGVARGHSDQMESAAGRT